MDAAITLHNLTKHFGKKTIVDGLSLTVPTGAIFALLGDNGAGKTTTIRMLAGLLKPDRGQAIVLGQDAWRSAAALREKVGYVPERPRFYDWMTVSQIGWFASGFHRREYLPRFLDRIDSFELDPSARLQNLSKGQYAKVALALALAVDPEVLILDEPTSGLDLFVRREFLSSMVGLAGEGRTIFISSHQIAEVERVASHVAFLVQGQLVLAAPIEELRSRIVKLQLRFDSHAPDPAGLGTVLHRNGTGKQWQVVLQDPNRSALEALRQSSGIFDFEESPLPLEEIYTILLGGKEARP